MNSIKVMVNGLPGKMAETIAKHAIDDNRFKLIEQSLTGSEILQTNHIIDHVSINLIHPDKKEKVINKITEEEGSFISVDFTHPLAVNDNAKFYCKYNLPFVMGTTGGARQLLEDKVCASSISAVIAPNMAKQIVGFQAMMEYAASTFPDLFSDYSLEVKESHQRGKADTSGTAKAIIKTINKFGVNFSEKEITKERDPENQKKIWKIPDKFITGHGWHTYTLTSKDKTVKFEFSHNVNGRDVYAKGTLDAVEFLDKKIKKNIKSKVFSMIDVLKK